MVLVLRQLRTLQEGIGREMAVQGMLQGQRAREDCGRVEMACQQKWCLSRVREVA